MIDVEEILKLSTDEKVQLIDLLRQSIADDSNAEIGLTEEQQKELDRRIDLHESGQGKTYSWDEVKAQVFKNANQV
jgi:putative addiction module component (TIGR02574 family)